MADPFSIIAATAGLVDVLWRVGKHIHDTIEAAGKIEEELLALSHDIEALISVNQAIEETFRSEKTKLPGTSLADISRVESLWKNVGALLKDCKAVVEKLEGLTIEIAGKGGSSKVTGKLDGLKKTLRRDKRDDEIKDTRIKLVNYQNSLQILLTALNLAYTRSSQDSTDLSLGHLSQNVQLIGFKLQSQIASLRPKLGATAGSPFFDAISSAADVASLISINKHFRIPQTVSSIFTGRDSLLSDLQGFFDVFGASAKPTNIQKRFIVYGLGGSGKTQFCCKFAQDNRQNFWGIFCVDARSPETAEHSFAKIAKMGNVESSEGSYLRAAKDWLSSLERPWLLLIDNADDTSQPLEEYFPEGERGCILVTTRDPTKRVHGTVGPHYYHFEKLATNEANDLLLKAACHPLPWDSSTIHLATLIADALGFLPLALVQAGKAIMNGLCSLANYIDHYQKSWQRIRHARRQSNARLDEKKNMNVYSSYEINLKSLEQSQDEEAIDAVQLLKMFSCFYCENIRVDFLKLAATNPRVERKQAEKDKLEEAQTKKLARPKTWTEYARERLFDMMAFALRDRGPPVLPSVLREGQSPSDFDDILDLRLRDALNVLSRMSLITHHEATDNYSMHPLVHKWVRERPEMNIGEQALWCQAATTTLAQCILLPPHGSSESEEDMRRNLLPHIDHVRKCQVWISARIKENQKGRERSWMPVLKGQFGSRQALESAKFSRVYSECGLWKEAEQLQLAVKNYVCGMLGTEHPAAMGIMLFLSATYWNQARTNEAAELQSQVYQACLSSLGPDHPKTLKVMDTLGSSRCFQGRYKEALELHQTAIEGMRNLPQPDREDLYVAMCNLGRVMWRYFRYNEAKQLHEQALAGLKRLLGPTHLQTLVATEDLAMSYMDCGEEFLNPAHEMMLDVLYQRKTRLGKEQPFTLLAICNLARIKSKLGRHIEAEQLFIKTLPIAERSLGENHFGTLSGWMHFAVVLVRQKRYTEAERIFVRVVEKQRYVSAAREDGDHPDRIFALWHLVECYELHAKFDEALVRVTELERVTETIGGSGLGKLHPIAIKLAEKRRVLETARSAVSVLSDSPVSTETAPSGESPMSHAASRSTTW